MRSLDGSRLGHKKAALPKEGRWAGNCDIPGKGERFSLPTITRFETLSRPESYLSW